MKKILSLILVLSLCVFAFAACADKKDEGKTEAPATENDVVSEDKDTAKEDKGVIKMATNAAFPPYEYKEGDKFAGIDVEIAQAIADELGYELEIVDMEFDSIITSVNAGETDFGMAGMTVTEERLHEVDFSESYATGVQSVIVPEGSDIKTVDDLAGKKIGVQLGTTGDIYSCDDFGEDMVTKYSKGADAVLALKGGDVDAVIIDNEPAKAFCNENAGLVILDTDYAVEDYAIAVRKGNTELLDEINGALETLTENGTIAKIVRKYISAE
ncbi:MAG: basic amino acid ABC transporter substrate-binding protein [Ruminococcaceae bacterium]|nr:basic amino acid ABC transporter substrate-binding protein [Oscillospiraceae bacterium]